jgi:hypothetical protein
MGAGDGKFLDPMDRSVGFILEKNSKVLDSLLGVVSIGGFVC